MTVRNVLLKLFGTTSNGVVFSDSTSPAWQASGQSPCAEAEAVDEPAGFDGVVTTGTREVDGDPIEVEAT